jgi:cold shock CspA family protein
MKKEIQRKRGRVKWYSKKKKYGFVVDKQNAEYFFHSDRLPKNSPIPKVKDIVEFTPLDGKRGKKAADIKVLLNGEAEKFRCPSCHEEIIPKIVEKERKRGKFVTEIRNSSICPNCDHEFDEYVENEQEKINLLFKVLFLVSLTLLLILFFN